MPGFSPNNGNSEFVHRDDIENFPGLSELKGKKRSAQIIDFGAHRMMAAKDPYENENPRTWNCNEHRINGIKEGDECPKCRKERERVEQKQAEKDKEDKKRA